MHRETYFDGILFLEEAGGYAQIQFLLTVSGQESGVKNFKIRTSP